MQQEFKDIEGNQIIKINDNIYFKKSPICEYADFYVRGIDNEIIDQGNLGFYPYIFSLNQFKEDDDSINTELVAELSCYPYENNIYGHTEDFILIGVFDNTDKIYMQNITGFFITGLLIIGLVLYIFKK